VAMKAASGFAQADHPFVVHALRVHSACQNGCGLAERTFLTIPLASDVDHI
jgi:hypothetical protein